MSVKPNSSLSDNFVTLSDGTPANILGICCSINHLRGSLPGQQIAQKILASRQERAFGSDSAAVSQAFRRLHRHAQSA
jgi:hypothetical protein